MNKQRLVIEKINDETCHAVIAWLESGGGTGSELWIDCPGGTTTPLFYQLVELAERADSVTAIAKRAHSAAAVLFLAFPMRQIDAGGELLFKPQDIQMTLKRASRLTKADLARYAAEYEQYSSLLKRLLETKSKVTRQHVRLLLEEEAMLLFDAENAVKASIAQAVHANSSAGGGGGSAGQPTVPLGEHTIGVIARQEGEGDPGEMSGATIKSRPNPKPILPRDPVSRAH